MVALLSLAVALLAVLSVRALRVARLQAVELTDLAERLREMGTRFEAAEADVAHAVTRADIAEALLVEKGVADEDDLADARRRFFAVGGDVPPPPDADERGGSVH